MSGSVAQIGQQVGNYRLVRLLGTGGFAEVYLGQHLHLHTEAAVKVLYARLAHEDIENFRHEAQTIARLLHPHIVRVLDFGTDDTAPYLIMDYAPNGTLRHHHPKNVCLPLPTVVSYVKQVAAALQYAHDQRLIHRDIKPENMLLGRNNEVLLSDFGIALVAQSSYTQNTQNIAGTIAYMAPEQIQAHPRPASDQYSLAIVAYEWLSGQRPFHGTYTEIAVKQSIVSPPPLLEARPDLAPAVEQVIMKALHKDPHQRFATIRAFANALEEAYISNGQMLSLYASPPNLGRGAPIKAVDWSPDATYLAAGGNDKSVRVYQATTGRVVTTYNQHTDFVTTLAWSHDSKYIASGSADGTVKVWDPLGGKTVLNYTNHTAGVRSVDWSHDDTRIVSGAMDGTAQIWDATSGDTLITYKKHMGSEVNAVAWSHNSKYIASGGNDANTHIWETVTENIVTMCASSSIFGVSWSPDDQRIVTAGAINKLAQVWRAL